MTTALDIIKARTTEQHELNEAIELHRDDAVSWCDYCNHELQDFDGEYDCPCPVCIEMHSPFSITNLDSLLETALAWLIHEGGGDCKFCNHADRDYDAISTCPCAMCVQPHVPYTGKPGLLTG